MNERDSAYLRGQLASVGILLDEPIAVPEPPIASVEPAPVDRAEVRRILIARGVPERSLHWLCRSCPSVEAAMTYMPPEET